MYRSVIIILAAGAISATAAPAQTGSEHDHSQAQQARSSVSPSKANDSAGHGQSGTTCHCPMMQHDQRKGESGMMQGAGAMQHGQMMQHQMRNTAANPFAEAEMRMHERMMAAQGESADETWVRKMIEHHRGAIETAKILVAHGRDQDVIRMARKTIASQEREIQELQAWLLRHKEQAQ